MVIWAIGETNKDKNIGQGLIPVIRWLYNSSNRVGVTQGDGLLPIFEVRREPVKDSVADAKRGIEPVK